MFHPPTGSLSANHVDPDALNTKLTASPLWVLTAVPAEADSVVPMRILWPVFAVIVRLFVVSTMNFILSPSAAVAGNVALAVVVIKYPFLTLAENEPLISDHVNPVAIVSIVIFGDE